MNRDTKMTCFNHAQTQKSYKPVTEVHAWSPSRDPHKETGIIALFSIRLLAWISAAQTHNYSLISITQQH